MHKVNNQGVEMTRENPYIYPIATLYIASFCWVSGYFTRMSALFRTALMTFYE